jgi:hypothetical protein
MNLRKSSLSLSQPGAVIDGMAHSFTGGYTCRADIGESQWEEKPQNRKHKIK